MTSPALAEALRTEIRTVLDAEGQPFTVAVARRVYDLTIASRDLLIAGGTTVADAIAQVEDTKGPLDSVATSPEPTPSMAAETFGVRLAREILAALPLLRPKTPEPVEGPNEWMPALILARQHGLKDVATAIETKMFGRTLAAPQSDRCTCPYTLQPTGDLSTHQDDCPEARSA